MHLISSVRIEGFWGNYDFEVPIDPRVTFLIGQNGTGKTTLINLIAAALTGDFKTLDRLPFRRVIIRLTPQKEGGKPSITVAKKQDESRPFERIDYTINTGGNAKDLQFSLDDTEEQLFLRLMRHEGRSLNYYNRLTGLSPTLQSLVSVKWLSIHRTSPDDRPREDRTYESTVDQKLESLSNELVRYFATLSKKKDDEIRSFQEYLFLSLIEQGGYINIFDDNQLQKAPQYKEALRNIFNELHVKIDTSKLLDDFSSRAKQFIERKTSTDEGILTDELIFRIGLFRIEDVVKRWDDLQTRLKRIFRQKDKFQDIADNLFQRKRMTFSESNEMVFKSRSGKDLTPQMLSSGEKQLLILLSEALLQREMPTIFIADEPELSLHVLWQEKLVASLHALNPNAQIIAATHSPDIVGPLVNKAIDMESLVK